MGSDRRNCKTDGCTKTVTQSANVRLPLNINAYAEMKEVRAKCCGEPEVQIVARCGGCKLVVSQHLSLTIAVEYGADVVAEDCTTDCDGCESV